MIGVIWPLTKEVSDDLFSKKENNIRKFITQEITPAKARAEKPPHQVEQNRIEASSATGGERGGGGLTL